MSKAQAVKDNASQRGAMHWARRVKAGKAQASAVLRPLFSKGESLIFFLQLLDIY
jgi:hypothetical protein